MIRIDPSLCVGCNACIRACPVNHANLSQNVGGKDVINVNDKNCIRCGACVKVCSHKARYYDDDTKRFFSDIKSGKKITLLVAPAVRVAFSSNWKKVLKMLRKAGADKIYDVSFGADNISLIDVVDKIAKNLQSLSCAMAENIDQLNSINEEYSHNSDIIEDIAMQIKILAVNASIGAAHVGEAGKGFAVVAGEVGTLADKTQNATQSFISSHSNVSKETECINNSITDIISEIKKLSDILTELKSSVITTGQTGNEISSQMEKVSDISGEIGKVLG